MKYQLMLCCAGLVAGAYGQALTNPSLEPGSRPLNEGPNLFHLIQSGVTVDSHDKMVAPLSTKQKFQMVTHQIFSPSFVLAAAATAGIQQAGDFAPNYGQGGEAYAKRFGAMTASLGGGSLLSNGVFPTVFHQDPRYFRKGSGSVGSRIFYAMSRVVVTRQDSGRAAFNISQVGATATSVGLTNLYYPESNRTASENATHFAFALGFQALINITREFDFMHRRR